MKKPEKEKTEEKKPERVEKKKEEVHLVRILAKDIPATQTVYSGLTLIKGISWAFSNVVCKKMNIDKKKKIEELSKEDISKIEEFISKGSVSGFLLNRRNDLDSGVDKHLVGSDLDLQKEFDIKRLKKIRCYKGGRHALGLPVRGQRTRSNFRKNKGKSGAVGVRKNAPAAVKKEAVKK